MKAIKMKSGRWRVSVYDYTDPEGRQHNKTFTGDTKKEALQKASNYSGTAPVIMTVAQAVGKYIETREPVLSPSTVASYQGILRTHLTGAFGGFPGMDLCPGKDALRENRGELSRLGDGHAEALLWGRPPSQAPPEEKAETVCSHGRGHLPGSQCLRVRSGAPALHHARRILRSPEGRDLRPFS